MGLKKLIRQCKDQNKVAQEQLYRNYSAKLFGVCLKYSNNKQQAEDNLQDGFLTIFAKIEQFKNEGSFEGWMKRIMVNTALQKHREQKVYSIKQESLLEQEDVEVESEEISLDFLLKCVQSLPDRYRQVFSMYALDGYSHREISEKLNISEGTSKSNLSRARIALKEKIEHDQNNFNSVKS